jgi:formylglycine-generating enzyme required for sulfatase activity
VKAESEARAGAERWRAEAELLAKEAEQLAREKKELQRQVLIPSASPHQPLSKIPAINPAGPLLIQIPTIRGWLEREGNSWQVRTDVITVNGYKEDLGQGIALNMVRLPAGTFVMGSPEDEEGRYEDEGPQQPVTLRSFFLGQAVVTQEQWMVVAGWEKVELDLEPKPSRFMGKKRPVENVNWFEAMEFCNRLSQRLERNYTLPSEAQWEYACRGNMQLPFAFGGTLTPKLANYDSNFTYGGGPTSRHRGDTTDVGIFPANNLGLHDMHGNVWEWCADHWHANYVGVPEDGRAWLEENASKDKEKLLRGGSWDFHPQYCRSAFRFRDHPGSRYDDGGFRVCCLPQD